MQVLPSLTQTKLNLVYLQPELTKPDRTFVEHVHLFGAPLNLSSMRSYLVIALFRIGIVVLQ
jgi:hypothetical protein